MQHAKAMRMAVQQAWKGKGTVSPNPMVGAVLVHKGKILSMGYHAYAGGPHAEVVALNKIKNVPRLATLYVTLEPCSTQGRTPACTDLILKRGVRCVVVGCIDPNPAHRGRAVRILRRHGVKVILGIERELCEQLNPEFKKYCTQGLPLGIAKMAMSLDGKVAPTSGHARWISCKESRRLVQRMRHRADAVLIGSGTVRQDNPRLTLRDPSLTKKKRPWIRLIADSRLSLSVQYNVFKPVAGHETWIATTPKAYRLHRRRYERLGIKILCVKATREGISLRDLFAQLGRQGITSVLIEGGPTLLASCLKEKVVDRLSLFIAPILLGGEAAPGVIAGEGARTLRQALRCTNVRIRRVGLDILWEGDIAAHV